MVYLDIEKFIRYPFIFAIYTRKNILEYLKELDKTQWSTLTESKQLQWNKLKNLIKYSVKNVPYYKELFKTLNISPTNLKTPDDYRNIPLLDKNTIQNNIDKIISSKYNKKNLIPNSTGGSTGVNLHFYGDKINEGFQKAIAVRNDRWAGLNIGDRNAILWGSAFDISLQNQLKSKLYRKIMGTLFLSSYSLSESDMLDYARKLQRYKPRVIVGYPSPLYRFTMFLEENDIKGIEPKSIISSAEVLYDFQKELLESFFQCEVYNRYGCREFGAIAHECSHHMGLHINTEHVYLECLNPNGEPAAPGEKGELVITDLDNYGMPFIRYRIGDVGSISEKQCTCGRGLPMLGSVEGRTFDVIIGLNGKAVGGTFWTLLLRTYVKGIHQFQVVQDSLGELNINVVSDDKFDEDKMDMIREKIHEHLGNEMKVYFNVVEKIPVSKSGKTRFVISKVSHEHSRIA